MSLWNRCFNALTVSACLLLLSACESVPTAHGEVKSVPLSLTELAQSDANRMVTLGMRDNLASLTSLMDKLYRRNPGEWHKGSFTTREAAMRAAQDAIDQRTNDKGVDWPSLQGKRDIAALSLALSVDFKEDRVAAFIIAMTDMLLTAHGGKTSFYLIDSINEQKVYNAARNMEIASWILATRRDKSNQPLLLADDISVTSRNLSFEREFGKIIARLDLLAEFVSEKYRRAVVSYVQNLLGAPLLQFLPVK